MAENISYLNNESAEQRKDARALPYRAAPQNVEAEQALIGAILINNDAYYRVSDFLRTEHFQEPIHRQIFKCASDMIRVGKKADPRSFCIQKTLQAISHSDDVDQQLMFAGHNAFNFKTDPFYSNGFVPTVKQLVERIQTGD